MESRRPDDRPANAGTLLRELARAVELWQKQMKCGLSVGSKEHWGFLEATEAPFRKTYNRLLRHPGHDAEELKKRYDEITSFLQSSRGQRKWHALDSLHVYPLIHLCEDLAQGLDEQQDADKIAAQKAELEKINGGPRPLPTSKGDDSKVKSIWEEIPDEYRTAIDQYETEAKAAKRERKRLAVSDFCGRKGLNETTFKSYREQVRGRKRRRKSRS